MTTRGVRKFSDRLKKDLQDPEFRRAFDEEETFASLAIQIARLRQKKGLSQQELAKRLHTTQQTVSRLEQLDNESYSLMTLVKLAHALHKKLEVRFI